MKPLLKFDYEPSTDVMMIEGIRYAGALFRGLATWPTGAWLKIDRREDGILTIYKGSDEYKDCHGHPYDPDICGDCSQRTPKR